MSKSKKTNSKKETGETRDKSKPKRSKVAKPTTVSRYVSFVVLCLTIVICGFFFYNVIKGFLLPLFLACLLAVIFRPFHEWVCHRVKNRPTIAAALSTAGIMLIVLGPLSALLARGLYEANKVIRSRTAYIQKIEEVRRSAGLQKPFAGPLEAIEKELRTLDENFEKASSSDEKQLEEYVGKSRDEIEKALDRLLRDAATATNGQTKDLVEEMDEEVPGSGAKARRDAKDLAENEDITQSELNNFCTDADHKLMYQLCRLQGKLPKDAIFPEHTHATPEKQALRYSLTKSPKESEWLPELVKSFRDSLDAIPPIKSEEPDATQTQSTTLELRRLFADAQDEYDELRTSLLGGPIWKWGIELVNPSKDQIDEVIFNVFRGGATRWLPSITSTATSLITGLMVGLGIMAVALFYFFMDGSKMVNAFMHLSPLDDRHEMELLQEFDKVSRAVVLATLLSAVAQGILGGIGYKIAGLDSVFLLTLLTTVLALIPFVGAAAVWVPCCLYLAFIKEVPDPDMARTWLYAKAGCLAVYGVLVISMADNFIKPWVLQGQSKLHPLLALLSVLGGVQALGPIGILVGPMVVAFLQVLLTILQREITSFDEEMKAEET